MANSAPAKFSPQEGEKDSDYVKRILEMTPPDHKAKPLQHYAWRTSAVIARAIKSDFYSLESYGTDTDNHMECCCNSLVDLTKQMEEAISKANYQFPFHVELRKATNPMWIDIKKVFGFKADSSEHNASVEQVADKISDDEAARAFILELGYLRQAAKTPRVRDAVWEKMQAIYSPGNARG